jgi:Protein of unknown function (DUF1311).
LLELDRSLSEEYRKLRAKIPPGKHEPLKLSQRIWLAKRDVCGAKPDCLKKAMESRLAALVASSGELKAASTIEQHGPFSIRYVKSPAWSIWGTIVPVIVKGPPGDGVAAIKQRLRGQADTVSEGCHDSDGEQMADYAYSFSSRVEYVNQRFFTLYNNWEMFCGGPHPEHGYEYVTYVVSSGAVLEYSSAFKEDLTAKTIVRLARTRLKVPEELKDPECRKDQERTETYNVAVVQGGLLFKQDISHAAQACELEVILPRKLLEPFIAPEGPLGSSRR